VGDLRLSPTWKKEKEQQARRGIKKKEKRTDKLTYLDGAHG